MADHPHVTMHLSKSKKKKKKKILSIADIREAAKAFE